MNLARSSLKLFAANVGSRVVGFLGIIVFARMLGPGSMGVYFLFVAVLGILAIPTDFGLRGAVEKRISEGESRSAFLSSAVALKLGLLLVAIFGILLLRPYLNSYFGAKVAIFLAIAIGLREAEKLSIAVLKGELRVEETAALKFARQVIWAGTSAVFITWGFGARGLIYGLLSGMGVVMVWGWYKCSVSFDQPSKEHMYSLFDYGKYNVVSSIGGYVYSWMDVALIGLFLTQAHVGAYEIAWRVTTVVVLFSHAIGTTIFPQISEWSAEGASERIEDLIPQVFTPSLILVIPAFFGILLFSKDILSLAFGPGYTIAWLAAIVLMVDKLTEAVHVVLGHSLQAVDRPDLAARATIVAVILNLVLNVILINQFGIVGAAIGTTVASLVGGVGLHTFYLSRMISIRVPYGELAGCVLASVGMTLILLVIDNVIMIDSLVRLFGVIALGAATYGMFLLLIPSLRTKLLRQSRKMIQGYSR